MASENRYPSEEGFYMPAEFGEHDGTVMIWPYRPGSWRYGAYQARLAFREIIRKLAEGENVYVLVRSEDLKNAENMLLQGCDDQKILQNIHLEVCESDDAWARDTGATYVVRKQEGPQGDIVERRGIDWQFNAWGGSYDGLYASWEHDQRIAGHICSMLQDERYDAGHFVLEGGSIHTDGEGTLLTTQECLLSPGRNPQMNKEMIEQELRGYLGVEKIIWLPLGTYNDETNGHVDNICAFTAPGEVVLAWTDDENDPQYARSLAALNVLENSIDARGRKLLVRKMPIPSAAICITQEDLQGYEFEAGEDVREVGERLAASYVNFYIGNRCVLVPQFGDVNDDIAIAIMKECFPDREIVPIQAMEILAGGGNIHCITQQIPKRTD